MEQINLDNGEDVEVNNVYIVNKINESKNIVSGESYNINVGDHLVIQDIKENIQGKVFIYFKTEENEELRLSKKDFTELQNMGYII